MLSKSRCHDAPLAVWSPSLPMKTARSRRSHLAFTLIELLVVISIIAILASLSFNGIGIAMLSAKRVSAKNDMAQIAMAVTSYYTEYGKYPAGAATSGTVDTVFGIQTKPNNLILNTLRYNGNASIVADQFNENPRQIQFIQPKLVTAAKGGVYKSDGNWYDPWGTQYAIFIDADYTGDITVSAVFSGMTTNPPFSVGVASRGYYYAKQNTTPTGYVPTTAYDSKTDLLSWQ